MNQYENTAANAAKWALSKVGCTYSQAKRAAEQSFDCSSLCDRAYIAQGKKWLYGGSLPRSNQMVYDDDFTLLWPESYDQIGKAFGTAKIARLASRPGDLQFLCTDRNTNRHNRITHVAMSADGKRIVHARGKKFGVCTNALTHYAGKICAITRYDPECTLRIGMKGYRTMALQKELNTLGADLVVDGEYGNRTKAAVEQWQKQNGYKVTGEADTGMLKKLGLLETDATVDRAEQHHELIEITGNAVNIRKGPGTSYPSISKADKGARFEAADTSGWYAVLLNDDVCWVSKRYSRKAK